MYSSLLALALNSATAADNTSCHKLDVMLMFDTTSSMYSLLRNAKFHASEIVSVVEDKDSSARYALAYLQEHPGENNQYDIPFQLVSDLSESPFITSNLIKKLTIGSGGDAKEPYGNALQEAQKANWSSSRTGIVVLYADSTPNDEDLLHSPRSYPFTPVIVAASNNTWNYWSDRGFPTSSLLSTPKKTLEAALQEACRFQSS